MITSNEQKELQRGISQEPKKEEYHNFITDNFICQNEIGSGSFGKVFRVLEKKTGKIYAAKISRQPVEEDSKDLIRNLTRKINIISQLNCPSILKFYGYSPLNFKGKPKPVIITEYASNGSLADILARERNSKTNHILNDTQKLIIIYGIASAMSYLHSHNIIHIDLKPDNILLDEFLFPKIADFGLSKNPDQMLENVSMKSINDVKGSPIYISPEIWNKCEYTKACDVYAFSLVLYEIVTNEKPFNKIDIFELWSKIHECYRPEIKSDVPEVYRRLIEKCWAEEPMNRPSFDDILNELKNNHDFITDSIQEKEFLKFVKYIDEYEVTFDSLKAVVPIIKSSMFNHIKINIISDDLSDYKIKIIEDFDSKGKLFPFVLYNNLDEESKKLVNEAEDSPKKQFVVGKYLIEGQFNFPQNSQIGIKYLKKSISNECLDALIYYCKMIIKGSLIPFNHKKVKKLLQKYLKEDDPIKALLYGKLHKKERNYLEAIKFFKKAIDQGNEEAMYEYAKIVYKSYSNEVIQYFIKAIDKGCTKAMYKYGRILKDQNKDEEALKYIKMAIDKDCTKALYYYSMLNDTQESIDYLKKAADKGHVEAMFKYGLKLKESSENKNEYRYFFKKAADKGHIESIYQYGLIIVEGDGVPANPKEGSRFIRIAANNEITEAITYYGQMLFTGNGVDVDKEEASIYYRKAIEKGDAKAMACYGNMLENGNGIEMNKKEAIKYYKKAIEKGNHTAMNNYGHMLAKGEGVEVDIIEAIKYYKMAIDLGSARAMTNYGYILSKGKGVPINKEEAAKYYKMAIEKGYSIAMSNYASMLEHGKGVPVDKEQAAVYYKMASDQGWAPATTRYGFLLEHGKGVKMNKKEAIKYYKTAIDKGHSKAMYYYGCMLERGKGTKKDKKEAIKYYKMAINKDNEKAMCSYGRMLELGKGVEINKEEAVKYYKMAIDKGCEKAMYYYGSMLEHGNGVPQDKEEAMKYYKMAADKGSEKSLNDFNRIMSFIDEESSEVSTNSIELLQDDENMNQSLSDDTEKAEAVFALLLFDISKIIKIHQKFIKYFSKISEYF